jgi:drug/metabolite transporter (DMT)-like permease
MTESVKSGSEGLTLGFRSPILTRSSLNIPGSALKIRHWLIFAFLGLTLSSSFLWIKLGVQEIGAYSLVTYRMLFGALAASAVVIAQKRSWPRDARSWYSLITLGLTSLAIPIFLISWGEQTIDSAVAAILNATVPLFTIVIAHLWLHDDRMTPRRIAGLATGFVGVVILLSGDLSESAHSSLLGQGAVVLAALFYGGSNVFARRYTRDIDGPVRGAAPLIVASAFMAGMGVSTGTSLAVPSLPLTWIAALWLGVLGSGIAMILHYTLIHEIGPTRTSMVAYVFPLGGVILGVIFLHEQVSWQLLAGSFLIISGIVIVNRPEEGARLTGRK